MTNLADIIKDGQREFELGFSGMLNLVENEHGRSERKRVESFLASFAQKVVEGVRENVADRLAQFGGGTKT